MKFHFRKKFLILNFKFLITYKRTANIKIILIVSVVRADLKVTFYSYDKP